MLKKILSFFKNPKPPVSGGVAGVCEEEAGPDPFGSEGQKTKTPIAPVRRVEEQVPTLEFETILQEEFNPGVMTRQDRERIAQERINKKKKEPGAGEPNDPVPRDAG